MEGCRTQRVRRRSFNVRIQVGSGCYALCRQRPKVSLTRVAGHQQFDGPKWEQTLPS